MLLSQSSWCSLHKIPYASGINLARLSLSGNLHCSWEPLCAPIFLISRSVLVHYLLHWVLKIKQILKQTSPWQLSKEDGCLKFASSNGAASSILSACLFLISVAGTRAKSFWESFVFYYDWLTEGHLGLIDRGLTKPQLYGLKLI